MLPDYHVKMHGAMFVLCGSEHKGRWTRGGEQRRKGKQGIERPLRGIERPLRGIERPLRGIEQPLRGIEQTLRGIEQLLRGIERPLARNWTTPGEELNAPWRGIERPLRGIERPLARSSITPLGWRTGLEEIRITLGTRSPKMVVCQTSTGSWRQTRALLHSRLWSNSLDAVGAKAVETVDK